MSTNSKIKKFIERATGINIYRGALPAGVDVFYDLDRLYPAWRPEVVLDVGANKGDFAAKFLSHYPLAKVSCFEPTSKTFAELAKRFQGSPNVQTFNMGISSSAGTVEFEVSDHSVTNRIVDQESALSANAKTETVVLAALDEFVEEQKVNSVGYLKIDTEGHELDVLAGAKNLISTNRVEFVELELGVNIDNTYHTPIEAAKSHMESHGYRLFGIYEQVREWPTRRPNLRRVNGVFASEVVVSEWPIERG